MLLLVPPLAPPPPEGHGSPLVTPGPSPFLLSCDGVGTGAVPHRAGPEKKIDIDLDYGIIPQELLFFSLSHSLKPLSFLSEERV